MLHVRVPLRHQSPSDRRQNSLHRGQPRPSGQPRRAVRQGRGRNHAALRAGAPDQAAQADRRARRRRLRGDRMGRGARSRDRVAAAHPRERPEKARVLHRARSEPGADRLVGDPVRHPQLRRARRLLLGQHGRGRVLYHRRLVLGVRRARLGAHPLLHAVRLRRGPRFQPAQDRARRAEGAGDQVRLDQPGAHRLLGHRRRVARHPPGHRRAVRARAGARAAARRQDRCRLPDPLHQRALAGDPGSGG